MRWRGPALLIKSPNQGDGGAKQRKTYSVVSLGLIEIVPHKSQPTNKLLMFINEDSTQMNW